MSKRSRFLGFSHYWLKTEGERCESRSRKVFAVDLNFLSFFFSSFFSSFFVSLFSAQYSHDYALGRDDEGKKHKIGKQEKIKAEQRRYERTIVIFYCKDSQTDQLSSYDENVSKASLTPRTVVWVEVRSPQQRQQQLSQFSL